MRLVLYPHERKILIGIWLIFFFGFLFKGISSGDISNPLFIVTAGAFLIMLAVIVITARVESEPRYEPGSLEDLTGGAVSEGANETEIIRASLTYGLRICRLGILLAFVAFGLPMILISSKHPWLQYIGVVLLPAVLRILIWGKLLASEEDRLL